MLGAEDMDEQVLQVVREAVSAAESADSAPATLDAHHLGDGPES
jgi:hypothetical protein